MSLAWQHLKPAALAPRSLLVLSCPLVLTLTSIWTLTPVNLKQPQQTGPLQLKGTVPPGSGARPAGTFSMD